MKLAAAAVTATGDLLFGFRIRFILESILSLAFGSEVLNLQMEKAIRPWRAAN